MAGAWLLYGANGYTGELIARRAVAAGERPVLAGRHAESVRRLAAELGARVAMLPIEDDQEEEPADSKECDAIVAVRDGRIVEKLTYAKAERLKLDTFGARA